jgi:hypothetical protein
MARHSGWKNYFQCMKIWKKISFVFVWSSCSILGFTKEADYLKGKAEEGERAWGIVKGLGGESPNGSRQQWRE